MLLRFIFVLFVFSSSTLVIADTSALNAQQWLEKMSQAMKVLNFQGTVAFVKNGRMDTMNYFHSVNQGRAQERLLSLNSPMREVIREAGKVSCVFKDTRQMVVNHRPVSQSFIVDLPANFSDSNSFYIYSLQGEESVAMLPTRVISIAAKDKLRYNRKVWIDKKSFLPLKIEVYDLSGETLEQVVFTNLQVGQPLEFVKTDNELNNIKVKHIQQLELSSFEQADFILKNVPSGFKNIFFTQMKVDNAAKSVDHLLLSDGFSSVSVYKEAKSDDIQPGLQTLGTVNSYTHYVDNVQITAMGEVPAKTVQYIAQGVKFK